jgi:hypothetical protein
MDDGLTCMVAEDCSLERLPYGSSAIFVEMLHYRVHSLTQQKTDPKLSLTSIRETTRYQDRVSIPRVLC